MKNMQNKQQQQQQHQPTKPTSSNPNVADSSQISNENKATIADSVVAIDSTEKKSPCQDKTTTTNMKIQRSSSSSMLEKKSNQLKKSRPNSANSSMAPVYKKLRPIEDPILQILDQIHKVLFIAQVSFNFNFDRNDLD
jgi:hypothetical protein